MFDSMHVIHSRPFFLSHLYRFEDEVLRGVVAILMKRKHTFSHSELEYFMWFIDQCKPCHHKARNYNFKKSAI